MNITVTTHNNNNEDSFIKGFASVNFNNEFVVNNITICESKDGNLYAKMPQRMSVSRNEKTGLKERVQTASFAPANKEAAAELNAAIIDTFISKESGVKKYALDCRMEVKGADAYYINDDNSNQKATLNIDLGDFYVSAAFLHESKNGKNYLRQCATLRRLPSKSGNFEEQYVDNFKPIKSESAKALLDVCTTAYQKKLNEISESLGNSNGDVCDLTRKNNYGRR